MSTNHVIFNLRKLCLQTDKFFVSFFAHLKKTAYIKKNVSYDSDTPAQPLSQLVYLVFFLFKFFFSNECTACSQTQNRELYHFVIQKTQTIDHKSLKNIKTPPQNTLSIICLYNMTNQF